MYICIYVYIADITSMHEKSSYESGTRAIPAGDEKLMLRTLLVIFLGDEDVLPSEIWMK